MIPSSFLLPEFQLPPAEPVSLDASINALLCLEETISMSGGQRVGRDGEMDDACPSSISATCVNDGPSCPWSLACSTLR